MIGLGWVVLMILMILLACAFALGLLAQILCLLFAPIAGFKTSSIARRQHLSALRYSLLGMVSAALFIMPWVYLMWKMNGESMFNHFADIWHAALHVSWFLFLVGALSFYLLVADVRLNWAAIAYIGTLLACLAMWAWTLVYYIKNGGFSRRERWLDPEELTHPSRIAPFVGASITAMIHLGPTIVGSIYVNLS